MAKVVGVRSQPLGKLLYCDAGDMPLHFGDYVVLDTEHGLELAKVVIPEAKIQASGLAEALVPVVRQAQPKDLEKAQQNQEKEALVKCKEMVAKLGLKMKPLSAHYNLDSNHLTIFFTAQERIDFRGLIRKLRQSLKTKVELRQIGARDVARLVSDVGKCGYPLCCREFLSDFPSVSIRMAKEQDLPLSPDKVTGICGRTLCCLAYENKDYVDMKEKMPRPGQEVTTPFGKAKVMAISPIKEMVSVELEDKSIRELPLNQLAWERTKRHN